METECASCEVYGRVGVWPVGFQSGFEPVASGVQARVCELRYNVTALSESRRVCPLKESLHRCFVEPPSHLPALGAVFQGSRVLPDNAVY
jgi:hypothetical protein